MSVYDAAANMIAFSNFVVEAAKASYGDSVKAEAKVAGYGRGSFITDLVFSVAGPAVSLFGMASASDLLAVINGSFELWKHLQGQPPAKIESNHNQATVTNNNGQIIQVHTECLNLVFSEKGAESAQQFVKTALESPGVDSVEVLSNGASVAEANQDESTYFVPVAPIETITDIVVQMALIIEAPVFKDGNKWRFSDGQQSFHANIADEAFMARVNEGERFGKGDVLLADVRISQQQSGMKLLADRTIVAVKEHRQAARQLRFLGE